MQVEQKQSKFERLYAGKMSLQQYEERSRTIARKVYESKLRNLIQLFSEEVKQIIQDYIDAERDSRESQTTECFIAEWVVRTTEESFLRFGDRNHLSASIRRNYISKTGTPLDVQALDMSETFGREISPEDLYQFMLDNPKGQQNYRNEAGQKADELKKLFKSKAYTNLTLDMVKIFKQGATQTQPTNEEPLPF